MKVRSLLACGALAACALLSVRDFTVWGRAWGACLLVAGSLFTRPSLMAQVIARGVALSVILPSVVVSGMLLSHDGGMPPPPVVVPPLLAAGALVLARPMLDRDDARATFAPIALRSWFLASATAAIGAGVAFANLAAAFVSVQLTPAGIALGALAVTLIAAGVGLVRMRGWSLVSGALASVTAIAVVLFAGLYTLTWPVLAAAIPGAMMIGGVVRARAIVARQLAPARRSVRRDDLMGIGA